MSSGPLRDARLRAAPVIALTRRTGRSGCWCRARRGRLGAAGPAAATPATVSRRRAAHGADQRRRLVAGRRRQHRLRRPASSPRAARPAPRAGTQETRAQQPARLRHPHRRADHLLRARPQRAGAGRRRLAGRLAHLRRRRLHPGQRRRPATGSPPTTRPPAQLVAGFRPSVDGQVRAIAATDATVYLGGNVTAVGGVEPHRLAAVSAANGALLPWAPRPGPARRRQPRRQHRDQRRRSWPSCVTGGGTQVVAGGRFDTLNGVKATGVGALDAVTGATRPFAVNQLITNQGVNSAVYSLSTDGTTVYGTGYDFGGPGNLEGTFAADRRRRRPQLGRRLPRRHLLELPDERRALHRRPRARLRQHRRLPRAATPRVRTSRGHRPFSLAPPHGTRQPPTHLRRRQLRRASRRRRCCTGSRPRRRAPSPARTRPAGPSPATSQYVVYGGEFPRVNGVGQQGLVRFAMPRHRAEQGRARAAGALDADGHLAAAAGAVRVCLDSRLRPGQRVPHLPRLPGRQRHDARVRATARSSPLVEPAGRWLRRHRGCRPGTHTLPRQRHRPVRQPASSRLDHRRRRRPAGAARRLRRRRARPTARIDLLAAG